MRFKDYYLLLLLFPLALLALRAWMAYQGKKKNSGKVPLIRIPWRRLWNHGSGALPVSPRFLHFAFYAAACIFFIVAMARPQTSFQKIKRSVEGIDIMLVMDLSASMRIEDFRDLSRFEVAQQVLENFINKRVSDKIGLQIFSGEAVTLVPPTLDYALLVQALKNVNIGDLKDGTAIGDALATAVNRLKESRAKSRVIILLTDGDSNIGQVDPLTAGELARGYGIKVYSIAIGRDGRVAMPFVQKDLFGRQVKTYQYFDSSINPELLKQISNATSGSFYRVQDDVKEVRAVFDEIDRLEKNKIETTEQVKYEEHFAKYLWLGIFAALAGLFLQQTFLRVYP